MKVATIVLSCLIVQSSLAMFLVTDDRLQGIKNTVPRVLANRLNDEFDEWRKTPSDTNINVMARLSFDKAKNLADNDDRHATGKLEISERTPISFRIANINDEVSNAKLESHSTLDKSLKIDRNLAKVHNPRAGLRNSIGQIKFTRKIPKVQEIAENAPAMPERELGLFGNYSDEDRRDEQTAKMSEIYRESMSRALNKYSFTEHLSNWTRDSVDEIHRFYIQGIREVRVSKDFLLDKMDDIYNNFITPVRWNQ